MNKARITKLVEGIDDPELQFPGNKSQQIKNTIANQIAQQLERERENEQLRSKLKPDGTAGDRKDLPYTDKDGNTITTGSDYIQKQLSKKSMDTAQKDSETFGTGVHGSPEKKGILPTMGRGINTIVGLNKAWKSGTPIIPAKDNPYEDESGVLRRFSTIKTGLKNGDPYYFEFIHRDNATKQELVLHGTSAGMTDPNGFGRVIPMKVKAIIPDSKPTGDKPLELPNNIAMEKIRKLVMHEATYDMTGKQVPDGAVNVPEDFLNHPQIKALLERWNLLDQIEKRVKVGSVYGVLMRKDPGDKNSIWKLARKIHTEDLPQIHISKDFEKDFEKFFPPGAAAALGAGALGLAALEAGVEAKAEVTGKEAADALGKIAPDVIELPSSDVVDLPDDDTVEVPDRTDQPDEYEDEEQQTTKRPDVKGSSKKKSDRRSTGKQKIKPIPGTPEHTKEIEKQKRKKEKIRKRNREAKQRQRRRDSAKRDGVELFPNHPDAKRKPGPKSKKSIKPVPGTVSNGSKSGGSVTKIKQPSAIPKRKVAESLLKIKRLTTGK